MSTTVDQLIGTIATLLTTPIEVNGQDVYPTAAGQRVYEPRDWPSSTSDYPAIFLSCPRGQKESLGRNQPQFTTTETIRMLARVDAPADASDGNSGVVQAALLLMKRQIEVAVIGAPALMTQIQQISSMASELGLNSGGARHLGELGIEMELEFYEGPDAFCPPAAVAITDMNFTFPAYPPVGIDVSIPQS
jgi:hypothetical protein